MTLARIGIVGAGVAGLAAARVLSKQGHSVAVFDKGRGPGGRASTRRGTTPLGDVRFDHGAQFFTARHPSFAAFVADAEAAGHVAPWHPRFEGAAPPGQIHVGVPGMNALVKALAAGLTVTWSARVVSLRREAGRWFLQFEHGPDQGPFDRVVIAIPAEQVGPLLAEIWPSGAAAASEARSAPCWAVMLTYLMAPDPGFDAYRARSGPIGWMAREGSKPGRAGPDGGPHPGWVVHAAPGWSRQHLEDDPETVAAVISAEARALLGGDEPIHIAAHRWRYAQIEHSGAEPYLASDIGLSLCGDWCIGPRIEAAFLSGSALGHALCEGV